MTFFAFCFIIAFNSQYSGPSKEWHNFFQLAQKWGVVKNRPIYMEVPVQEAKLGSNQSMYSQCHINIQLGKLLAFFKISPRLLKKRCPISQYLIQDFLKNIINIVQVQIKHIGKDFFMKINKRTARFFAIQSMLNQFLQAMKAKV